VRVRKVVSERVEHVAESAIREEVVVDRVVVNRVVDAPSAPRREGDMVVIPVFEEIVTVQRKWLLKEELRVSKRAVQVPFQQSVVLREEHAEVERSAPVEKK
jgi:stress response protein YsnF